MNKFYGAPAPRTLAERLARLNDGLQALGERLRASIAGIVGEAVADAARDAVRGLLGGEEPPPDPYRDRHYRDDVDDPWGHEGGRWREGDESYQPTRETPRHAVGNGPRWRSAMGAAVRAWLWFLKRQPRRRPVLTTLAVTLVAGVAGFVAGPALAAGAGVFASVAGLILTADASKSVAELAAG